MKIKTLIYSRPCCNVHCHLIYSGITMKVALCLLVGMCAVILLPECDAFTKSMQARWRFRRIRVRGSIGIECMYHDCTSKTVTQWLRYSVRVIPGQKQTTRNKTISEFYVHVECPMISMNTRANWYTLKCTCDVVLLWIVPA